MHDIRFNSTRMSRCFDCQSAFTFNTTRLNDYITNSHCKCRSFLSETREYAPAADKTQEKLLITVTTSIAAAFTSSSAADIPAAARVAGSGTQSATNDIQLHPFQCHTHLQRRIQPDT